MCYLRKYDDRVTYNAETKKLRPIIGILFIVENNEYFASLSSPKQKHKILKNKLDLIKIDSGNLGVVNFNNMIPINKNNYEEFDLNKITIDKKEMNRIKLLNNQLRWLTSNRKELMKKSKLLYDLYNKDKLPKNVRDRCCNFPLLEEKCKLYNKNDN